MDFAYICLTIVGNYAYQGKRFCYVGKKSVYTVIIQRDDLAYDDMLSLEIMYSSHHTPASPTPGNRYYEVSQPYCLLRRKNNPS